MYHHIQSAEKSLFSLVKQGFCSLFHNHFNAFDEVCFVECAGGVGDDVAVFVDKVSGGMEDAW